MPVINVRLPFKNGRIWQIGDTHEGTEAQMRSKIDEAVRMIKEDNGLWAHTGDAIEGICVDHPYYESTQHKNPTIDIQVDEVVKTFKPIAKKLISMNVGNHEDMTSRQGNATFSILQKLDKIPAYGAWTSIINFYNNLGEKTFEAFFTHGFTKKSLTSEAGDAGQRRANTEAKLKKMLSPLYGTAIYQGLGHYHSLVLRNPTPEIYLTTEDDKLKDGYTTAAPNGFIHPDDRFYGCNGGWSKNHLMDKDKYPNTNLKNLEPIVYSEKWGCKPVEIGMIRLNIRNWKLHSCDKIIL